MNRQHFASRALAVAMCSAALSANVESQQTVTTAPRVSAQRLEHPAPGEWLQSGREYSNQRYSPLTQITRRNVGRLVAHTLFQLEMPTALPRSSIVVSDEPLSEETNYRTEFVAVLSDQPQGGFITRKPTVSPYNEVAKAWQPSFFSFFDQPSPPPPPRTRQRLRANPVMPGMR